MAIIGIDEAYHNLAAAIVVKGIEDYKSVLKRCRLQSAERHGYIDPRTRADRKEIEDFFDSPWCDTLLGGMNGSGRDVKNHIRNRIYREA